MIRFRLMKGVYTDLWILALCVDGYPRYEAKYQHFEDAWRALWRTFEYGLFVGYPLPQPQIQFKRFEGREGPMLRSNVFGKSGLFD